MADVNFADTALPKQADAVIVGAGLVGLFSAHYLERAGLVLGGRFSVQLGSAAGAILTEGGRACGVRTVSGQTIATGTVVVAAGAFSRSLASTAGPELGLESRRRHGITAFLPDGLVDQSWPMVVDADLGLYWRPRPEGIFVGWE